MYLLTGQQQTPRQIRQKFHYQLMNLENSLLLCGALIDSHLGCCWLILYGDSGCAHSQAISTFTGRQSAVHNNARSPAAVSGKFTGSQIIMVLLPCLTCMIRNLKPLAFSSTVDVKVVSISKFGLEWRQFGSSDHRSVLHSALYVRRGASCSK